MSQVEIKDFKESQLEELLEFLIKWSPDHPELGEGEIIRWQKCFRFVALFENKIVGYMAQIPHDFKYGKPSGRTGIEKLGWAVTLVLDLSDNDVRKQAGRGLLTKCENNPPLLYSGVGMVPGVEGPYKRRGHVIRRDSSMMYTRLIQIVKMLKYQKKSSVLAPPIKLANLIFRCFKIYDRNRVKEITEFNPELDATWDRILSEQKELYGIRDATFLNYKLSQPNRDYHVYIHEEGGYIIFRTAKHRVKDLFLVKVCDLVGTEKAKSDLLSLAVEFAYKVRAYGLVAMGSYDEKNIYKRAGLYISKPYAIVMRPQITAKMHITFFDSDLDNLW